MDPSQKESPFSPGRPVAPELFTAREEEINFIRRKLGQAAFGRNENVFVLGDRGMGKSSLASLVHQIAAKEYGFYGVHCHLGGVKDIPEFVRVVFQEMVTAATDESVFVSMKNLFEKYIRSVSLFGISVEFTDNKGDLEGLAYSFLPAITTVYESIRERHKGILLILDDLNGISAHPQFAHFIKSFVDGLATSGKKIPLVLLLAGLPERRAEMVAVQPSVARIFDLIDLSPLRKRESENFFRKAFTSKEISIEGGETVLSLMAGGYPMLMHELGDAVFWENSDQIIDAKDILDGWNRAIVTIGTKYLDPGILDSIKSEKYRSILTTISTLESSSFTKKDIVARLNSDEQRVLGNFLTKSKKGGLLKSTRVSGEYVFANLLYRSYIRMRFSSPTPDEKA